MRTVDERAKEHGEEHQVVILNPNHGARRELCHDSLGEGHVGLAVREPVLVFEVHLAGVVVEERPEDGVGEAVVVPVGEVVVEVDCLALELVPEALVDERSVFWRDVEARPAYPDELHGFLGGGEGGDEAA